MAVRWDDECIDVEIGYSNGGGYHVVLELQIPTDAMYPRTGASGPAAALQLDADGADALARELTAAAASARAAQQDLRGVPGDATAP